MLRVSMVKLRPRALHRSIVRIARRLLVGVWDAFSFEDYAVVALLPGSPSRSIMILAGTTTFGTQGAVDYVCRQNSVEELLLRLFVSKTGELKPFEALLRVKVTCGVPVQMDLVALRRKAS